MPEQLTEYKNFADGNSTSAYKVLGCHFDSVNGTYGAWFRVWAPNAKKVSVAGDFNGWDTKTHSMYKVYDSIWEIFVAGAKKYDKYKYYINYGFLKNKFKSDPYQFYGENGEGRASICYDLDNYKWNDGKYLAAINGKNIYKIPMNIYEMHMGSWKQNADGSFYNYTALADELIKYVKNMGFTHIEIMPIMEYPFDGSWGYQVTGYFSPTSRYGTPEEFKYFVDKCHENNIGVILDWVPAHFCKDEHGLIEFDGSCCYESSDIFKQEHKGWGTRIFDYSRFEVQSFLISNALFWLREYHLDGLRVDAVASMLYLDYDRKDGEWKQNVFGGNYNLEAIDFFKKLNTAVFSEFPNALMVAEESTAFPGITLPVHLGGLGFNFKWNMGWMNDMLSYMSSVDRRANCNRLTFPFVYYANENHILPISHDEVVHGKKSLLDKMPGGYEEKFDNLRLFYAYMVASPGKKLLFMGSEFGQFIEWNFSQGLDFLLMDYKKHKDTLTYVKELNEFYNGEPCLFQEEKGEGFEWIKDDSHFNCVITFKRKDSKGNEIIFAANFSSQMATDYEIKVKQGEYKIVFDSSLSKYSGSNKNKSANLTAIKTTEDDYVIKCDLPPYSARFLKIQKQSKIVKK